MNMRKTWMLSVIFAGCLLGVTGCSAIVSSLVTEVSFTALSTIFATLLSDLLPAAG